MTYEAHLVVRSAVAAMRTVPARPLAAVAAACGVSRHTLLRAFRKCGPHSPAEVRDLLLHERMNVLMTAVPPKSIKEISDGLGFTTSRSFARWLKREDGVVPRVLRDALCRRLEIEELRVRGEDILAPALPDTQPGTPLGGGACPSPPVAAPGAARGVTYDVATGLGRRLSWLTSRGPTCRSRAAAGAC